jgi:hypothetical protein
MADLQELLPAEYNKEVLDAALKAFLDGGERQVRFKNGQFLTVRVWEIYRSIMTTSVRLRLVDRTGRVHHINTNDVEALYQRAVVKHD